MSFLSSAFSYADFHPVYDFGILPSDLAGEKILLINAKMVGARIEAHGPPPSELQEQRDWYQDALRDALKLAAKTNLVLPPNGLGQSSEQSTTPMSSSYSHLASATGAQPTGYNTSNIASATPMIRPHDEVTQNHSFQLPSINAHVPEMHLPPIFSPEDPQSVAIMTTLSHGPSDTNSGPSSVMTQGDLSDIGSWGFQDDVQAGMGQTYGRQYNFDLQQGYGGFDPSGPDMLEPPQYPPNWTMQQGRGRRQ